MAQLYFIYSTMNSGKSLDLLKTAHNYESQGKKVLMFTSRKDTRTNPDCNNSIGKISTRIGLEREAYLIENVDCFELASKISPNCVLVDEAQFLEKSQVLKLAQIVDELGIPVICYGLKNAFRIICLKEALHCLSMLTKFRNLRRSVGTATARQR